MGNKYPLIEAAAEEMALFYSSQTPGRDMEIGCIGHMRADFGRNGKEFWHSWEDHCPDIKTQAFKDELADVIDSLRDGGILKDRDAMVVCCFNHFPNAKLNDGRDSNFGFKIKTEHHVYYLRCCPRRDDYNLYCYAYNRETLEKHFPSLTETVMTDELRSKLENVVKYVIETSARETTTGRYFIDFTDIPADIISPKQFATHVDTFINMIREYEAIAAADVDIDGFIDIILYTDYCPNYEPLPGEQDDFPPDRKILDPLKSKCVPEPDKPHVLNPAPKPTLAKRLEKNKKKAATQGQSAANKSKKREEIT